ncbi:MAG: TRAP transporter substrate-binding protein [Lachnospiraceae bacterium]|jgi:TRAP-type C4-dicarboxylate transport system substrate-binding protein|nr:TRAP transporter substrate-binding protein [Lachnospiraceae bacterium]MCI9133110.1 TRAP transporter substrate-binding protein [Lachnospiraceae bacterium]
MKRIIAFILTATMALGMLAGCGKKEEPAENGGTEAPAQKEEASTENTGEVYEWSLGTIYSDPATSTVYNAFGEWVAKFCELAAEKTNGQVKITPYYNSVLGSATEMYEQARRNEIQVFCSQPMSTIDSRFGMTSIPGIFEDYDMVKEVFTDPDSDMFKLMNSVVEETGMTMLANNMAVFRVFYNSKNEIHTPQDMNNLTVRIYEDTICSEYWSGLCSAVVIPYSELFMSLQTGVVDGAEHTMSSGPSQLYEVCSYCSDINWQWTWGGPVIVNTKAFEELPADLQEKVREAAIEACAFYDELWEGYNNECAEEMTKKGITYYELNDEERQTWTEYARSLDAKLIEVVGEDFYNEAIGIINSYSK